MLAVSAFETFLRERGIPFRERAPLGPHTTLKVGGPADFYAEPRDEAEVAALWRAAREADLPFRVLGAGANVLIGDAGVRGVVARLTRLRHRRDLHVQAGYSLPVLVKETVAAGLSGLECLAGVPATVGGAVRMNAGGRHGDMAGAVSYVDVVRSDGELRRLRPEEVGFRYRGTNLDDAVIVAAGLALRPDRDVRDRYEEILSAKKRSQPLGSPNAGCMFKNPPGGRAGRLIEEAGLKGERVGRVHVSRKHANFMINEGGATADDVFRLIDRVRSRVAAPLELEVLVW